MTAFGQDKQGSVPGRGSVFLFSATVGLGSTQRPTQGYRGLFFRD
jgi:hypothetical protein